MSRLPSWSACHDVLPRPRALHLLLRGGHRSVRLRRPSLHQGSVERRTVVLYPLFADDPLPARADVTRAAHGTYIGRLLLDRDSTLDRWPDRVESPIRVWVEPTAQPGFADLVRDAFGEWADAGLPIRFEFVDRARDAEISRAMDRSPRRKNREHGLAGRITMAGCGAATSLLATQMRDGRRLDARSLSAIALHEVGHVLGSPTVTTVTTSWPRWSG